VGVKKTFPGRVRRTADPSTSLRSGRDDKGDGGAFSRHWLLGSTEQQVPPLRGAPVGMTLLLGTTREQVDAVFIPFGGPHRPVSGGKMRTCNTQDCVLGYFQSSLRDLHRLGDADRGFFNGAIWPPGCQIDDGSACLCLRQIRGGTVYWLM
jgi:hypothetical protein